MILRNMPPDLKRKRRASMNLDILESFQSDTGLDTKRSTEFNFAMSGRYQSSMLPENFIKDMRLNSNRKPILIQCNSNVIR